MGGGITNNVPCFGDKCRRQIVFDLAKVSYPLSMTLVPADPAIEALLMRGALEMRMFAASGQYIESIRNYDRDEEPPMVRMLPTASGFCKRAAFVATLYLLFRVFQMRKVRA